MSEIVLRRTEKEHTLDVKRSPPNNLDIIERLYNNWNMRSVPEDRKTATVIRDTAMELFARSGASNVTIREIASKAGVSPGLVMHHFGSKEGLKDALDARAVAFIDDMVSELVRLRDDGGSASLAEMFASRLEQEPALAGYVGRLLLDGSGAGDRLFTTFFQTTVTALQSLESIGVARHCEDEGVRAAFLLVNDLALILLRHRIEAVIGVNPLSREGLTRWSATVFDIYSNGVFALPGSNSQGSQR